MAGITYPISDSGENLVSVVMPVRNGMPYLPLSIESLLNQTYRAFEIIVVDDGSSDGTSDYLKRIADPRLRVIRHETGKGIVAALNSGIAEAKGEFIARQDADDLSAHDRIGCQVEFLRKHSGVAVVASHVNFIAEDGSVFEDQWTREVRRLHDPAISSDDLRRLLPLTCCIAHGSIMARKTALMAAGGYRTDFEWAEDYDLWLRLLPDYQFAKIPRQLYSYRVHNARVSAEKRHDQIRNCLRSKLAYLRRSHPHLPPVLRTWIQGENLGAEMYRALLSEFSLVELPLTFEGASAECDLIVVTEFNRLDEFESMLSSGEREWSRTGNFFLNLMAG